MKKKTKRSRISSISRKIAYLFAFLFGSIRWRSPAWLKRIKQISQQSPKLFWGSTLLIFVLILSGAYGVHWFKNRPKPTYITAQIKTPEITPNEEVLVPQNLVINFGIQKEEFIPSSVAPISLIGKTVTKGIEINPKIAGEWHWNNDHELIFIPTEDWPAGQKYTIHCASDFFAPQATMQKDDFSFTTKPFKAKISEFKFYQDPVNSELRNAVATIEFNYPVNMESIQKNTSLAFEAIKKGGLDLKSAPLPFSYSYDHNKRIAYLHSDTIKIKEVARYLLLTLNKSISSSTNSTTLKKNVTKNLLIPDASNFLQVTATTASIVRNDKDRPEQILNIETSLGVQEQDLKQSMEVYVLPKNYPATAEHPAQVNYTWQNPGEINKAILALATPLTKEALPTEQNYSTLHSFKFKTLTPAYLYIKISKGMKGFGGFSLTQDYAAVVAVPEYPKEISFLHKGSLLALNSEKKLSALVRGISAVKFDFARVLPNNVNQMVTQTQGDFNNPYFINPSFNQQNISQIFSEIQQFDASDLSKQQYTALDLGKYLTRDAQTPGMHGLFLLQATAWDTQNNTALDTKASRLILVTDLGMLVKDNNDASHDVFLTSITQGQPVAGATVTVLGKNGLPILSATTDAQGQAHFPSILSGWNSETRTLVEPKIFCA